jgi:hypothetical protein
MPLTDLRVRNLKPESKPRKYSDGGGLYLQVNPSGTKCWRLRYTYFNKSRTLAFGTYPEISLEEARNKRHEARRLLLEHKDPSAEKREEKRVAKFNAANSFEAVAAEWHNLNEHKWTPEHASRLEILRQIQQITGDSPYIFPSQSKMRHLVISENTINKLLKQLGYKGRLVAHGFRSLASTTLNEMGYPADVIERQLAHCDSNKVRAAYNRAEYLPQRVKMMQDWADYIDNLRITKLIAA